MKSICPFKNIAIVGVGLIGGSIGLGLKKYSRGMTITGIGRNMSRLRRAKEIGAIDRFTLSLRDVRDNDLIILSQPVGVIKKALAEIARFLEPGQVVIDVGGTKEGILKEAHKRLPSGVYFIGTHPLAGSEKSRVEAASPDIFCGSKCIIIRDKNKKIFKKIASLFRILGSEVISMDCSEHDELIALISHLPHLVAQALVAVAARSPDAFKLASSGFRDTTRIALSSPEMWRDIFIENKKNILKILTIYEKELKKFRRLIDMEKKDKLLSYLGEIKEARENL